MSPGNLYYTRGETFNRPKSIKTWGLRHIFSSIKMFASIKRICSTRMNETSRRCHNRIDPKCIFIFHFGRTLFTLWIFTSILNMTMVINCPVLWLMRDSTKTNTTKSHYGHFIKIIVLLAPAAAADSLSFSLLEGWMKRSSWCDITLIFH